MWTHIVQITIPISLSERDSSPCEHNLCLCQKSKLGSGQMFPIVKLGEQRVNHKIYCYWLRMCLNIISSPLNAYFQLALTHCIRHLDNVFSLGYITRGGKLIKSVILLLMSVQLQTFEALCGKSIQLLFLMYWLLNIVKHSIESFWLQYN